MFLKRLSTVLCVLMCSGFVWGTNPSTKYNSNTSNVQNTLVAPLALGVQLIGIDISCFNENDGKVRVIITDGAQPFTWELYNDKGLKVKNNISVLSDFIIQDIPKGNYQIHVKDLNNVITPVISNVAIVNEPTKVNLNLTSLAAIQCTGGTGKMVFSATSSYPGFNYSVTNQTTNQVYNSPNGDFLNLPKGFYTALVLDSKNCPGNYTGNVPLQLTEPFDLNTIVVVPNQIACFGETGSALIQNLPTNSGIDAYGIQLKNTRTNIVNYSLINGNTFVGLDYGNYELTLTRQGCVNVVKTFSIEEVKEIVINAVPSGTIDCYGSEISLNVTVSGGKVGGTFTLELDDNDVDETNNKTSPPLLYGAAHVFTEIGEGNYSVKCVDSEDTSCVKVVNVNIAGPASPLVYLNEPISTSVSCFNSSTPDGKILISVTGGSGLKTYFVDGNPFTTSLVSNLVGGNHTVFVKDAAGCETEEKNVTIGSPTQLVVSHDPVNDKDVSCPKGANGEIHLTISGGVGNYKYDLASIDNPNLKKDASTTANTVISTLAGGIYSVTVKDGNSCIANSITGIELKEPDPITISLFDLDTIQCFGNTATLKIQATGGADPTMNYKLMKGAVEVKSLSTIGLATFDGLEPASTYKIIVTSGTVCTDFVEQQFSVVGRKELIADNLIDSVMLKCSGDVPSISLTIQGESPFQYSIDGNTFQNIIGNSVIINSGLSSSVVGYPNRIILKDRFGCEAPIFVTIYEPVAITGNVISFNNETCKAKNDGNISLNVSGGTIGNYLVSMVKEGTSTVVKTATSANGNNISLTNIPAGTYDFIIEDKNKCKALNPPKGILIEEPSADLVIDDPVYNPLLCNGDSTLVTFTVSGGWDTATKTIRIVQGTLNKSISTGSSIYLKWGTYTLNASNSSGCVAPQRQFTISQPQKLSITATSKNVTCFGDNDASISLNVAGGTAPFRYGLLGLGSADKSFTGTSYTIEKDLIAGKYQLIVQDTNGCQSNVQNITINEPVKVTFALKIDSVTCFGATDGKITVVEPKGGNDNVYSTYIEGVNVSFPIKDKLSAKRYIVYISDGKGCKSDVLDTIIKQPEAIVPVSAIIADSVKCYNDQNGKITVNATGGLPYDLQYRLVGTTVTRSYQVSNEFGNLPSGDYEVWVRNSKGNCAVKFPGNKLKLINPSEIKLPIPEIDNVTCHNLQNGKVDIGTTGGTGTLNYSITNSSSILADNPNYTGNFRNLGEKNRANTNYNYRIEDVKGCFKTGSFSIKNPDEIVMTYDSHEQVTCNSKGDGWIKVNVIGGNGSYSFLNNIGSTDEATFDFIPSNSYTIKKYSGGTYTPVVLDAQNCVDTLDQSVDIYEPQPIEISAIEWGEKLCNGDMDEKSIIHVIGGTPDYKYSLDDGVSWSDPNDSLFIGIPIGVKIPRVKDRFECLTPNFKEFLMSEPELFTAKTTFYDIKCHDDKYGDLKLDLSGGVGPYSFSIDDPTFETDITEIDKTEKDTTSFMLSKNDILLFPDITYKFYIRDANKCNVRNIDGVNSFIKPIAEKLFLIPEELVLDSLKQIGVKCENENSGVIRFSASGGTVDILNGYKLMVTNIDRNITKQNTTGFLQVGELFSGPYKVELHDANGCVGKTRLSPFEYDTISVDAANESIKLSISAIGVPKCNRVYNGWIEIDVADFYEEGVSFIVERWDSVLGQFTIDDPKWQGIIPAEPDYSNQVKDHELFFAYGKRIVENIGIGKYQITVIDNQSSCDTSVVTLITSADGDECPPLRYFNVFSPHNGDDANNEWTIYGSEFQNYTLQVFTSYGEMVYSDKGRSDVKGITWKGVDQRNRPVPVGTYIYLLRKNEGTPQDTTINGNITILRGNGR